MIKFYNYFSFYKNYFSIFKKKIKKNLIINNLNIIYIFIYHLFVTTKNFLKRYILNKTLLYNNQY